MTSWVWKQTWQTSASRPLLTPWPKTPISSVTITLWSFAHSVPPQKVHLSRPIHFSNSAILRSAWCQKSWKLHSHSALTRRDRSMRASMPTSSGRTKDKRNWTSSSQRSRSSRNSLCYWECRIKRWRKCLVLWRYLKWRRCLPRLEWKRNRYRSLNLRSRTLPIPVRRKRRELLDYLIINNN